ncbi:MAG: aminotransferase class V-fold PLP-dependent enzyme, partial [Calditrichaeota bacterium]
MLVERRKFLHQFFGGFVLWSAWPFFSRPGTALGKLDELDEQTLWRVLRRSFPLTRKRIYFNTGGLGPSPSPVLAAVEEKRHELEQISETGHHYFDEVRKKLAAFVGADAGEIAFTRNATEGMNFIARGVPLQPGDEV